MNEEVFEFKVAIEIPVEAPGLLDPIERIHKALEQIRVNGEILHWTIQLLPKDESGVSENQLYRKYHS